MTRKDYVAVAQAFKDSREGIESPTALWAIDRAADNLSRVFQRDNLRFDRDRFLAACAYGAAAVQS